MGSLGFQHTKLHLVCIIKAYITVYNSVGTKIEARRKCTFIRIPKMRIHSPLSKAGMFTSFETFHRTGVAHGGGMAHASKVAS